MTRPTTYRVNKRKLTTADVGPARDEPLAFAEAGPRAELFANAVRAHADLREPDGYAEEIRRLWAEAARKFLAIGEYLLQAKDHFAHGEKMKRLEELLPFGYPTAHRLMRIAEAVRLKRLSRDRLPANYATAYLLTTLSDADLDEAKRRDLIREDVTRKALEDYIAERRNPDAEARRLHLSRERARLVAQMERMRARIAAIEDEIGREVGAPVIDGTAEAVGSSAPPKKRPPTARSLSG